MSMTTIINKITTKATLLVALLLLFPALLKAEGKSYLHTATVENVMMSKSRGNLKVRFTLQLNGLKVPTDEVLLLTPVIKKKGSDEVVYTFPQIQIKGRNRHLMMERMGITTVPQNSATDIKVNALSKEAPSAVPYLAYLPDEEWAYDAELHLLEQVWGCAECQLGAGDKLLVEDLGNHLFIPNYQVQLIEPKVEPVKIRADKHTATIEFVVAKHNIDRNFGNNDAVLREVERVVDEVVGSDLIRITSLAIGGYASPEASAEYNQALSERRAQSFVDWLVAKYHFSRSMMSVSNAGEDWAYTRQLVAESNHPDRQAVLDIIDSTPNPDDRDPLIKALSGGATYQWMLTELYPQVRRSEYTLTYEVRSFNVEEAREIIKTNPKLLSLNEMYMVAHSYQPYSKEFKEVFEVAMQYFPEQIVAVVNVAATDMKAGLYRQAIERLEPYKQHAEVWNNLGVAYWVEGDLDNAFLYLNKAAEAGNPEATANLAELLRVEPELKK